MNELEKQVQVVAKVRRVAQLVAGEKKLAILKWEEDNCEMLSEVVATTTTVNDAEVLLRELTLQAYRETGSKSPAEGVGIRETIKLEYDTKVAFDWAKSHKMALKLDTSAFEKIVRAAPVDFVKSKTEPQATIAQDLDEARKS